jgi:phosphotransferase system IIB component
MTSTFVAEKNFCCMTRLREDLKSKNLTKIGDKLKSKSSIPDQNWSRNNKSLPNGNR